MRKDISVQWKGENVEVSNSKIKVKFSKEADFYIILFFVKTSGKWVKILANNDIAVSGVELRSSKERKCFGFDSLSINEEYDDRVEIFLKGKHNKKKVKEIITISKDSNFIGITDSFKSKNKLKLTSLLTNYSFIPEGKKYDKYKPLDFVYTPNLRPEENQVIGDHVFRSPAVILQKNSLTAAVIPDVLVLDQNRKIKNIMDLQVDTKEAPFFSFGIADWKVDGHVFYRIDTNKDYEIEDEHTYSYYLYIDGESKEKSGHEKVVRFMWEKFGTVNQIGNTGALNKPLEEWGKDTWYDYAKEVWMDVNINGEEAGALKMVRLSWSNHLHESADNDGWFNVWFQNLRTAYGMYIYGKRNDDPELVNKGIKVLRLALNAPQKDGIFPSIYYYSNGHHWAGDQGWGGIGGNFYTTFHSSFQCYWLLKWYYLIDDNKLKERIIRFCENYAAFIEKNIFDSGVLPSWFDMESMLPSHVMKTENAETAAASLFLTEMYLVTKNKSYLDTAMKTIKYLEENIIPENKWFDYETFFSCSLKPVGFYDNYTKQHPQNNLSLYMAVEAYKNLYLITKEETDLDKGLRLLDYLLLYQQVWSPKFLSRKLFGGFGVQNTDGEWSDARQAYFAITLLDFFEITGKREYFERAIEAARAMFGCYEVGSVKCYENYAHSGVDRTTGVTGILWGNGSTMTSVSMIQEKYGDLYIDVENKWAKAINYFWVENLVIENEKISFDVKQPEKLLKNIKVVFGNCKPDVNYEIIVNGVRIGKYSHDEMKGVKVKL